MPTFTRIHRHLGLPLGTLTFEDVVRAVEDGLREEDDLDYKAALPPRWDAGDRAEFAKDVAAMANTIGGLLVYGVTDDLTVIGVRGVTVDEHLERQLRQVLASKVEPFIDGVEISRMTSANGTALLLVDVPASDQAPHLVQESTGRKVFYAPQRYGSDTNYMSENQLAEAYRSRFARYADQRDRVAALAEHASELGIQNVVSGAWLILTASPASPVAQSERITYERVADVVHEAIRDADDATKILTPEALILPALGSALSRPRIGYRRWVVCNFLSRADATDERPILLELHDDGSVVLAVHVSRGVRVDESNGTAYVDSGIIEHAVAEFVALQSLHTVDRGVRSAVIITAGIAGSETTRSFEAVEPIPNGEHERRGWTRRIPRVLLVTLEARNPLTRFHRLTLTHELASGLLNQFGLNTYLARPLQET